MMLLSGLAFTVMQLMIKDLSRFHVFQIIFFRCAITAVLCMISMRHLGVRMIGRRQKWLVIRAVCGLISMILFFVTIARMPLGAAVTLRYLSPVFTALFAVLILSEKVKPIQWVYFLGTMVGVALLKGFDVRIDGLSLGIGLLSAVFAGMVYVLIRKIGDSEHPLVIINYFMVLGAVFGSVAMLPYWETPVLMEWVCLIAIGVVGFVAQWFMTRAFQREPASRLAMVKYVELLYTLVFAYLLFGESYHLLSLGGMLLILIFMILNVRVRHSREREG